MVPPPLSQPFVNCHWMQIAQSALVVAADDKERRPRRGRFCPHLPYLGLAQFIIPTQKNSKTRPTIGIVNDG
jgi:hypothetical protein